MALQHYHQMINNQFMNLMLPHISSNHPSTQQVAAQSEKSSTDDTQIDVMTDDTSSIASDDNSETSPKKSNFSISAILGLEKNDLKTTICHWASIKRNNKIYKAIWKFNCLSQNLEEIKEILYENLTLIAFQMLRGKREARKESSKKFFLSEIEIHRER